MTVRSTAVALLALAGIAIAAPPAFADSINVLRRAETSSPAISFHPSQTRFGSEDQAAELEEECIALADREPSSSWQFGSERWNFGQHTWEWDPASGPTMIYLLCVDPERTGSTGGRAMHMMAALPWSGAPATHRNAGTRTPTNAVENPTSLVEAGDVPSIGDPPGGSDSPAGAPGFPEAPVGDGDLTPWRGGTELFPMTFSSLAFGDASSGVNDAAPFAPSDPPIILDPREWADPHEMAPVPEPGTWLLMGTGLAAAWRAARKRK